FGAVADREDVHAGLVGLTVGTGRRRAGTLAVGIVPARVCERRGAVRLRETDLVRLTRVTIALATVRIRLAALRLRQRAVLEVEGGGRAFGEVPDFQRAAARQDVRAAEQEGTRGKAVTRLADIAQPDGDLDRILRWVRRIIRGALRRRDDVETGIRDAGGD